MKKLIVLLLSSLVAFVASAAVGDTFEEGNLAYRIIQESTSTDYAKVAITGLSTSGKAQSSLQVIVQSTVTHNSTIYAIDYIGTSAFDKCTNITGLDVRYGLKTIYQYALRGCTNLSYVRLPSSITRLSDHCFYGCSALKNVYIAKGNPADVSIADETCLPGNSGMTLYVPRTHTNSVELWKSKLSASGCGSKFSSVVKSSLAYDTYCSDGAYLVVTSAPNKSVAGEMALVGIDNKTPDFKPTGDYGFAKYSYKLTAVSDSACMGNNSIVTVDMSKYTNLKTLGGWCFAYSTSLTEIIIPKNVNSIATITFVIGSSNLFSFSVNDNNQTYTAVNGMLYSKNQKILYRCPEGRGLKIMRESNFPSAMTTIDERAFYGNCIIEEIYLPYGLVTIGQYAFQNCKSLSIAKIPSTATGTKDGVFYNCTNLATLYCNLSEPTNATAYMFYNCKKTTLYRPAYASYSSCEGWKEWKTIKKGSYDWLQNDFKEITGSTCATGYTLHDNSNTYNGVQYDGWAELVFQTNSKASGTLTVPGFITYTPTGKKYAVVTIGEHVFPEEQAYDTKLVLGQHVSQLSMFAFYGQKKLIGMTFNANLKYIGQEAFYGCGLTGDIVLPYGIKRISYAAFGGNALTRVFVPSSANEVANSFVSSNSTLTEVFLNCPWGKIGNLRSTYQIPTGCKLYVPVGQSANYKSDSYWNKFTVLEGAYDFAYNGNNSTTNPYHMTVTSTEPLIVDGVTYDGTAKYVYNPYIGNSTYNSWTGSLYEIDRNCQANKKYYMTEIGDSAFVGCNNVTEFKVTNMKGLENIGNYAFYGTNITGSFTVPASCRYIGKAAFVSCPKLTELFLDDNNDIPVARTYGGQFYGLNAANFMCYAYWPRIYGLMNEASWYWNKWDDQTKLTDQLNAYIQTAQTNLAAAVYLPIDWEKSGIKAYVADNYKTAEKTVYLKQVKQTPKETGLMLKDLTPNKVYRLQRATATVSAPSSNLLNAVCCTPKVDVSSINGYAFNYESNQFVPSPKGAYIYMGESYMRSHYDSATAINIRIMGEGIKGDVDGNGEVDITDANILINIMLGKDSASKYDDRADVTGDGVVDVSDMNAVLNIILGK